MSDFKPGDRVCLWDQPDFRATVVDPAPKPHGPDKVRVRLDGGGERLWHLNDLEPVRGDR
ncbi:hypothetical protein SEA_BEARBQ_79 [Gordonia phage BearBQ]|nr:hypothetical protein SEA_BEARBQ_79 [Gordonia phage BearBQ]